MHFIYKILFSVGILLIAFVCVIFTVATVRVIKRERAQGRMTETIACGEQVVAVLTTKNNEKEFIR